MNLEVCAAKSMESTLKAVLLRSVEIAKAEHPVRRGRSIGGKIARRQHGLGSLGPTIYAPPDTSDQKSPLTRGD